MDAVKKEESEHLQVNQCNIRFTSSVYTRETRLETIVFFIASFLFALNYIIFR